MNPKKEIPTSSSVPHIGFDSRERLGFWLGVVAAAHVLIIWILYALMFRDVEIPESVPNDRKIEEREDSIPWTTLEEFQRGRAGGKASADSP